MNSHSVIKDKVYEKELVERYISKKKRESNLILIRELGYQQKKIDLLEFDKKTNLIHGIEFKVQNWKEGISQCLGNRVLLPFNSLAIYHRYLKNVENTFLERKGIGLICITNNDFEIILEPKKSDFINLQKYSVIKNKCKKVNGK